MIEHKMICFEEDLAAQSMPGMFIALIGESFKQEDCMIRKLTKSILVAVLVIFCGQAVWAADSAGNCFASVPEFKVQVRILDLVLTKVEEKHRVTHMIAEIVNITDPSAADISNDNQVKEAHEFLQKNAKQVTIMVTPEAEKQGKLLGFFHPFVNGIHKSGVFKADSTIRVFQLEGMDGWQMLMTECHLLDK
ncbi:MAG: hypothetical protein CVV42_19415 [Candidatus Riflebacteria bacterium HGW-Riflebacteria-2]|nr:MAG: hypothetical protein CVV42_19415 [Candidatus Riflebacteria bacterium HGW-Riflebacteria-2]